jgi:hypothetical protein
MNQVQGSFFDRMRQKLDQKADGIFAEIQTGVPFTFTPLPPPNWDYNNPNDISDDFIVIQSQHYIERGKISGFVTCGRSEGTSCVVCDTKEAWMADRGSRAAADALEPTDRALLAIAVIDPRTGAFRPKPQVLRFNLGGPRSWGYKLVQLLIGQNCYHHPTQGMNIVIQKTSTGSSRMQVSYDVQPIYQPRQIPEGIWAQRFSLVKYKSPYNQTVALKLLNGQQPSKEDYENDPQAPDMIGMEMPLPENAPPIPPTVYGNAPVYGQAPQQQQYQAPPPQQAYPSQQQQYQAPPPQQQYQAPAPPPAFAPPAIPFTAAMPMPEGGAEEFRSNTLPSEFVQAPPPPPQQQAYQPPPQQQQQYQQQQAPAPPPPPAFTPPPPPGPPPVNQPQSRVRRIPAGSSQ